MISQTDISDDEISLVEVLYKLRRFLLLLSQKKKVIARVTFASVLLGLFLAYGSERQYQARSRLLPYRGGQATAGGLSGLAGLAGIRIPVGANDQTITADLYPEVAQSIDFQILLAEVPLYFSSLNRSATAVEFFSEPRTETLTEPVGPFTIGLPRGTVAAVRKTDSKERETNGPDVVTPLKKLSPDFLRTLHILQSRLSISVDKKTSIVTIAAEMPDPYASADLVRVAQGQLMKQIIEIESRKSSAQFRFVSKQHEDAKNRFDQAQQRLAYYSDRNRIQNSAISQLERDKIQREVDLSFEIYQQLSRELEQAKIKMNQDTPVFTVLEEVTVPVTHSSPKRAQILFLSLLFGAIVGILIVTTTHLAQHWKNALAAK